MKRLLLTISALLLTGCASITGSKLQPLSVQTIHENREVVRVGCTLTNDTGKWFVTTPGTVTISKSTSDLAVDCRAGNSLVGNEVVSSKANGGVWGNLLAGGLVGYVVDSSTGAGFDYPNTVTVTLRQLGEPPVSGEAATAPVSQPAALAADAPQEPLMPSTLMPKAVTVAEAPPPPITGQFSFQVRNLAKTAGCSPDPLAKFIKKGPGFELYDVACANGDSWTYRCEFGNCRQLK